MINFICNMKIRYKKQKNASIKITVKYFNLVVEAFFSRRSVSFFQPKILYVQYPILQIKNLLFVFSFRSYHVFLRVFLFITWLLRRKKETSQNLSYYVKGLNVKIHFLVMRLP